MKLGPQGVRATLPRAAAALAVLLAFAPAPLAWPQQAEEAAPFIETVDVTVVNVDVYVTDKSGQRVTGLTADDFELWEDGRRVEISNFYAVEGGRPVAAGIAAAGPAEGFEEAPGPPPVPPGAAPRVPEEQRLHLVVYLDNLFMRPFNRNKVVREVRRFLYDRVGPEDRVMLVTSERALHVRQPFTSDVDAVTSALDAVEILSGFAVQAASERREILRRIDSSKSGWEAAEHVEFHAKSVRNDLMQTLNNLKEVVSALAGLPGRKALLYVSDGIPMSPAEDLFLLVDRKYGGAINNQLRAASYRARREFQQLTARANANRVTFYTLEAAGLRSHSSLSAEYGGRDETMVETDFMHEANQREPLLLMAADTGGLATISTNNFDAGLEAMAEDFDNYYSLGYRPVHAVAGRYYDLEVKVKRPGLEVRHRAGYRDKSPEARLHDGTLAALLFGSGSNPLEVRMDLRRGRPAEDGRFQVPLEVRIPIAKLTLVPQQGDHNGRVRVAVSVIDEEGGLSPPHQVPIPIAVPAEELETAVRQDFVYAVELLMRRGEQQVSVGVLDEVAGTQSYVRELVRVGS